MLPKNWCLKVTDESLSFVNLARKSNPSKFLQDPISLSDYNFVGNDDSSGNISGFYNREEKEEINLETFKQYVLHELPKISNMSLKKSDLKVGVWYKFVDSSTYHLKFEERGSSDEYWGSEHIASGEYTGRSGKLSGRSYIITVSDSSDIFKKLPSSHPDRDNFPSHSGTSTTSFPKSSPDHKFSVGDRVIYQEEKTVITKLCTPGHYIVEYSSGWGGDTEPDFGLEGHKKYHWAYDSSLKLIEGSEHFKVGDRVKYLGKSTVVVSVDASNEYVVEYEYGWVDGRYGSKKYHYAKKSDLSLDTTTPDTYKSSTPSKKWSVGDKITYKPKSLCKNRGSYSSGYYYGGDDQDGFVGTIARYSEYISDIGCYKISVSVKCGGAYLMVERDFYEYDGSKPPTKSSYTAGVDHYSMILGQYNVGDIVISLEDISSSTRMKGDIFEVLSTSDADNLRYGTSWASSNRYGWRLATYEEQIAFRNGVKNIKNMSSNPCAEVLLADSSAKKSSKMQALPHQTLVESAQPKKSTKLIY